MLVSLLNILVAVAMGGVVLAQQTGLLLAGDAFFVSVAILGLYTAYHLGSREGMPIGKALRALLLEPRSHGGQTAYWAYVVSAALGALVIAQSVLTSA
jgi:hypothetical protein